MSSEVKKYKIQREKWDAIIRKAAKEAGTNVQAGLDKRYSSRPTVKDANGKVKTYGWSAYERYFLANGHTLFFSIDTEKASVSSKPDKYAQAKVEKREKLAIKKATKALPKAVKKTPLTKYDPALATLESMAGVSASSKKHNAKKAHKVVEKPVEVTA